MSEPDRDVVLVVDDSPDTLSFLTEAIERSGATVLIAVAGDLALALVDEVTPDVILLDAVMPGLDGFETCRRLKAKPHLAAVPVIFMTGLSETEHIVQGFDAGGVDYVTKPIAPDEILARIRTHLAVARAARSARAALDTTGRTLLAVSAAGAILWCTPQAGQLLAAVSPVPGGPQALPAEVVDWLRACLVGGAPPSLIVKGWSGPPCTLGFVGGTADEILLRLSRDDPSQGLARLRANLPLTAREAEVLLWLAQGKSSRDIGDILGLSHRTVTKHLEAIYAKLGVENRTAASMIANRYLQASG